MREITKVSLIDKKVVSKLRKLQKKAYPKKFLRFNNLNDCRTGNDLVIWCIGRPNVWLWSEGYCIATENSIVDIVSITPMPLKLLRELLFLLAEHFQGNIVEIEAREKTSYKLIHYGARKKRIKILSDDTYLWDEEIIHSLRVVFNL